jgi:hypothetical protein
VKKHTQDDTLDILHGVREIAKYLRQPVKKTNYQIAQGQWPIFRTGKLIHARKSELSARASANAE